MAEPNQRSFLLRLWRDHAGAPWRTTLIDVAHASEARHFADLDALCAFLRVQADEGPGGHDTWDTTYCTPSETS